MTENIGEEVARVKKMLTILTAEATLTHSGWKETGSRADPGCSANIEYKVQ